MKTRNSDKHKDHGVTRNTLICTALGLAFGLFSEATDAQNAQCTLVTGSKAGQVVPVTINPAPPLNASCSVGSDRGYISRTSAATNVGCQCTLFTGPNAGKEFPYNGALPLAKACKVGADTRVDSEIRSLKPTEKFLVESHMMRPRKILTLYVPLRSMGEHECPVRWRSPAPGRRRSLPSRGVTGVCLQVGGR